MKLKNFKLLTSCVVVFCVHSWCVQSTHAQSLFRPDTPPREQTTQPTSRPKDANQPDPNQQPSETSQAPAQSTKPIANKPQDSRPAESKPAANPPASQQPAPQPAQGSSPSRPTTPGAADRAQLAQFSLFSLEPPEPRDIMMHDTVFIIINETSKQSSTSKLDTKTSVNNSGRINSIPDLAALLELQARNGDSNPLLTAGMSGNENWKGDGKYERSDRFTDRIAATVIDVRPNGTLVLEARRVIGKDDEVQTVLVSGIARREDVTNANTVLSSQLADLTILSETTGELREATQKGWITRVFEAVFNF